jgi:hypothetical protein
VSLYRKRRRAESCQQIVTLFQQDIDFISMMTCNDPYTGWCRETITFEIITKNEGNLQNFI